MFVSQIHLRLCWLRLVGVLTLALLAAPAFAGVEQISESEFRALAAELSGRVNLFHDAWEQDPAAQFYGGTTRDYLYWLKGAFRDAHSRAEAQAVVETLRARAVIDVREFIVGDSDVDLFSAHASEIRPSDYGVRKIDVQAPEVLDPTTSLGRNEVEQGYLPAEKIRLQKSGLAQDASLGDGLHEIYTGKLTAHFSDSEVFARSKYAAEGLNHPVLLAIRYLRLAAINYYREHGAGAVDARALVDSLDPASAAHVRSVIAETLDGKALKQLLQQAKFRKWLNGGIQKSFRSYTNPNAAKALMDAFRVTDLPSVYPQQVEPVNQYVFAQHRDEFAVAQALVDVEADTAKLYRPVKTEFPDGFLYHGTRNEEAFRAILFQGVLGSVTGKAGPGLYGVGVTNQKFAEGYAGGPDRLLRFPVREDARVIDITEGEGARLWSLYRGQHGDDFDGFAARYGADLLSYPYQPRAYVVKNSGALGRAEGVHRQLLTLPEILTRAGKVHDPESLLDLLSVNNLTKRETELVLREAKIAPEAVDAAFRSSARRDKLLEVFYAHEPYAKRTEPLLEILRGSAGLGGEIPFHAVPTEKIIRALAANPPPGTEEVLLHLNQNAPALARATYQFMAAPGVPAMPSLLRFFSKRADYLPLGVFANPAYAPYAEEFDRLLAVRDLNNINRAAAADALVRGPWLERPDLFRRVTAIGTFYPSHAAQILLRSERWFGAHPDLVRAELERFVTYNLETSPAEIADVFAFWSGHSPNPLSAEMLAKLLPNRTLGKATIDLLNEPGFRPFRDEVIHRAFRAEPALEPEILRHLVQRISLSEAQRAEGARAWERGLLSHRSRLNFTDLVNFARGPFGIEPSPTALAMVDEALKRETGWNSFVGTYNGIASAQSRAFNLEFLTNIEAHMDRWLRTLNSDPATLALAEALFEKAPPKTFFRFWREALARPDLPASLRSLAVRNAIELLDLQLEMPNQGSDEALYLLLDALPEVRARADVAKKLEALARLRVGVAKYRPRAAFPARLLAEDGKLPPDLLPALSDGAALLREAGIVAPIDPSSCSSLYKGL